MKYDYVALYNKNAAFYTARPRLKSVLRWANGILTYGFVLAYLALWAYGIFLADFSARDYARLFFVPASALFAVSMLRRLVARARPYTKEGANITPLVLREGREDDSFPSRHLTCAAVIATVFLPYLPIVGCLLLVCTLGLAYARFALGMHYPSDLFAGTALGVGIGLLAFVL